MKTRSLAVRVVVALATLLACSGEPATPEDRVRATLAAIEAAAEARDVGELKEHVSEAYADARGQDKRAVSGLAAFHFMRNQSVHLLTLVRDVELPTPGEARATALVAMAGRPIPGPEALAGLRADLYRFEVELREEDGAWRVTGADWAPAAAEEFQ
jgi:hypothetical protein